jgi:hypothetical protein
MLVAKHGIGKSSVVRQVSEDEGIGFYDVRLSQCEVGDIKGLPFLNEAKQRTEFLKPYWWPRDPDSKGVLFFDELNRATKDVLQAVFEICLDRRLDGEKLPEGWRVVAAINASDDYDVVELDPALLDRWFYIDFEPTPKEWMSWATKSGVHPSIVDFVAQNPEMLDPPVGAMEAGKVYPSRRSWMQFDNSCKALNIWDSTDEGLMTQIAKGWLGSKIAVMFPKFYLNEYSRLSPSDILDDFDKVKTQIEASCSDIEVVASISSGVCNELKNRSAAKLGDSQKENIKKFMQLLPKDVASKFWVEILAIPKIKKIVVEWQKDDKFSEFVKSIYCR